MPVTIPHTFAGRQGNIPASELDDNFSTLATAIGQAINVPAVAPGNTAAQNRAALQAAIDALPSQGGVIQMTQYGIHIDAPINITKPVLFHGPGLTETSTPGTFVLYLDTASQTGFNVTGKGAFLLDNISMFGATGATHVVLNGPAGAINGTESAAFDNCLFEGGAICIDQQAALFTKVTRCFFHNYTAAGLKFRNTINPDQGDSYIAGNIFLAGDTPYGILWNSSGGQRILGNKFLGNRVAIGIDVLGATQDFIVADNSIESFDQIGIEVNRTSGAASILYIDIHDNQISRLAGLGGGSPTFAIAFSVNDATYAADVKIHENFLSDVDTGIFLNGGTRYWIYNNELLRMTTGSATGMSIDGAAATVYVGPNRFTAVTTPIAGTALAQVAIVDTRLGFTVATLPASVEVGSVVFCVDALGPADIPTYTGYGMIATAGGSGAICFRQGGQWRC